MFSNEDVPKTSKISIEAIKDIDYINGCSMTTFSIEFRKFGVDKNIIFEGSDPQMIAYLLAKIRFLM